MFEIHTTKEGDSMLIFQMEDSHLINTIKLKIRHMQECRKALNVDLSNVDPVIRYSMPKKMDVEAIKRKAAKEFQRLHTEIQPYILCAYLRHIDLVDALNEVYGNNGRVPNFNVDMPLLSGETETKEVAHIDIGPHLEDW